MNNSLGNRGNASFSWPPFWYQAYGVYVARIGFDSDETAVDEKK